jgi:VWFA-related protein
VRPPAALPLLDKGPALPASRRFAFGRIAALAVWLCLGLAGAPGLAQLGDERELENQTFADETSVVLIEVPVQVLVGSEPVSGLTADNFELYDQGERREIYSFDVLDHSAGASAAPLPVTDARSSLSLGPHRNFLFVVDFAYPDSWDPEIGAGPITAAVHGMKDTWRDLAEMLEGQFQADDRMAFAFFSPLRGLKMLQGWTTDRAAVAHAMELLRLMVEVDPERLREAWRDWEVTARRSRAEGPLQLWATLDDLLAEARTAGTRADPFLPHDDVTAKLFEGLINAGKTLDYGAGPRHVVYLSTGFPGTSLRNLRTLVQQFRRSHWAIQSVHTGGLGFGSDSLHLLSSETGGQVFTNSNDVSTLLGDLVAQTAVTYTLTFEARAEGGRESYRKLKVRLVGGPKGARVVHRKGYYSAGDG